MVLFYLKTDVKAIGKEQPSFVISGAALRIKIVL